jgi:CRP-like cAMP-binding protein
MVSLEMLRPASLFEGLADDQLAQVARIASQVTFQANQYIFRENDAAANLYIVVTGRVAVLIEIGSGKQTMVDTISHGETFGWSSMVPPHTMTASAKAVEPTVVVAIPGAQLRDFCLTDCRMCFQIMENLARTISLRLKDTRLQLTSLAAA